MNFILFYGDTKRDMKMIYILISVLREIDFLIVIVKNDKDSWNLNNGILLFLLIAYTFTTIRYRCWIISTFC